MQILDLASRPLGTDSRLLGAASVYTSTTLQIAFFSYKICSRISVSLYCSFSLSNFILLDNRLEDISYPFLLVADQRGRVLYKVDPETMDYSVIPVHGLDQPYAIAYDKQEDQVTQM